MHILYDAVLVPVVIASFTATCFAIRVLGFPAA
jgi:hypothetical protein